MKKYITIALIFFSFFIYCEEKNETKETTKETFLYLNYGIGPFPLFIPSFGIGVRTQSNHIGFDFGVDFSTIYYFTSIKATPSLFFYPDVDLSSQFYIGAGANVIIVFQNHKKVLEKSTFCFSPEITFGRKYQNCNKKPRIFEARISIPTFGYRIKKKKNTKVLYCPIVYFKYGIGF